MQYVGYLGVWRGKECGKVVAGNRPVSNRDRILSFIGIFGLALRQLKWERGRRRCGQRLKAEKNGKPFVWRRRQKEFVRRRPRGRPYTWRQQDTGDFLPLMIPPLCPQNLYCLSATSVHYLTPPPVCADVIYGSPQRSIWTTTAMWNMCSLRCGGRWHHLISSVCLLCMSRWDETRPLECIIRSRAIQISSRGA